MKQTPTIFLIDDDSDDQEIFCLAIKNANETAQCVFADDGIHALEKIKADTDFNPDFIFIDMNMPRMNGQQCLTEIKKIERLSHIPVFMYSTSADPLVVAENKKLGASDYIIKPSSIGDLSKILAKIIRQEVISMVCIIFCLCMLSSRASAQTDTLAIKDLKKLSIDQLMNIEVTSVSKSPEKLSEVASAIQVVTGEEIRRSGALRLPGALRLATNMQVTSSGSHDTRISSRGFNGFPILSTSLANKLLVLIDGRTVYTPLFGGVFWDVQNVVLEDIKQVEVISGPGGALWGANAVNGIVNVISKSARETQGVYASGASGGQVEDFGTIRYGSHVGSTLFYRVYGQRFDYGSSKLINNVDAKDAWNMSQGGFRMDYIPSANSTFTLQGDLYDGKENDTGSTLLNGQNVVGRWTHSFSDKSGLTVQSYLDRTYRNIQSQGTTDELTTYDVDIQHSFSVGDRNKIVLGGGYRVADDNIHTLLNDFTPADKILQLYNVFIQDQVAIVPEHLELTVGTKVLHNDYTDFEFHPTIRLAWTPNSKYTVWTAVSRAVRTPTRLETDDHSPGLGAFGNFKSEKVVAYELGYRVHPVENISFSVAGYYNRYTDLRSVDTNNTPPPVFYFGNNLEANTYGVEVSANAIVTNWWKLHGGYTWLREKFTTTATTTFPYTSLFEALDPQNQFLIQSMMDVAKHFEVDGILRYVDVVPAGLSVPPVPSYMTFDLRLAWNYKWFTASVAGQNLAEKTHGASGNFQIGRSAYGKITFRF